MYIASGHVPCCLQVPNNTFELVVDIVTITGSPVETTLFVGGESLALQILPL